MISLIVAMTRKGVIGRENRIPWNIPEELDLFKSITLKKTVVMGRKTYESIGHSLPDRRNIVVSSNFSAPNVEVFDSVKSVVSRFRSCPDEVFVIGGAATYESALPFADKIYVSYVKKDYEGDVYFPFFDESKWIVETRKDFNKFEHVVYVRK